MFSAKRMTIIVFSICLLGCSENSGTTPLEPNTQSASSVSLMQTEFMARCLSRVEYQSRDPKKVGKHCRCIFKTAMKGRSGDEKMTIAFYLYGNNNEAFLERYRANPPNLDAMGPAVVAIEKAVRRCPM